jgi:hypothetical protein
MAYNKYQGRHRRVRRQRQLVHGHLEKFEAIFKMAVKEAMARRPEQNVVESTGYHVSITARRVPVEVDRGFLELP